MHSFVKAMRLATRLTLSGDLKGATGAIRAAISKPDYAPQSRQQNHDVLPLVQVEAAEPDVKVQLQVEKPAPLAVSAPPARKRGTSPVRARYPLAEVITALGKKAPKIAVPSGFLRSYPAHITIPEGASFTAKSFTCAAGTRSFKLYQPASLAKTPRPKVPRGLIVMLHGCKQNPDDFAIGTNMNAFAEAHGLLVAYPAQTRRENAGHCWNWFNPADQIRDSGEPAIIAGLTRHLMDEFKLKPDRVFAAGLSAGAAMAVVLGETYPDVFAAIGVHSGLPYKGANDVMSAFAVMGGRGKRAARAKTGKSRLPRTIIFQGEDDKTVHPSNADDILADIKTANGLKFAPVKGQQQPEKRAVMRMIAKDGEGQILAESWVIKGLGHAWSGGQSSGSFTDPQGPDASAHMVDFFLNGEKAKA
jgi:poly(hydroxyalkanoate) depolymerase family esterase